MTCVVTLHIVLSRHFVLKCLYQARKVGGYAYVCNGCRLCFCFNNCYALHNMGTYSFSVCLFVRPVSLCEYNSSVIVGRIGFIFGMMIIHDVFLTILFGRTQCPLDTVNVCRKIMVITVQFWDYIFFFCRQCYSVQKL